MAKKSVGRLAGLAALGAAAYMMSKGKDKEVEPSGSTKAARPKSTETGRDESPIADAKTKSDVLSAITKPRDKSNDAAGNDGVISAPVSQSNVTTRSLSKVDDDKNADRNENYSNEGRNKPEIKTEDKPLYKQKGVTIGGVEKRTEGNKPMPSLKKVEKKAAARKASISTDEMKNRSRRINPKTAPFRKANIDQIPGQNRSGPTGGERVSGTELSRNLSNTAVALSPLTGGTSKVAAEFAMGRNAAKALQGEGKLSAAGQRLKNMEEVRNVAMPGRNATVTNPNAWAAGPKGMDKIAQAEARAAAAEARAAAAEAKRNSKDPFMSFKPGSDFKRGGMTKMASGGMTASRRGDGIASRGKTKCKMY